MKWAGLWLGQLVLYAISFWYQNKPGVTSSLSGDVAISATKIRAPVVATMCSSALHVFSENTASRQIMESLSPSRQVHHAKRHFISDQYL